MTAPVAVGAGAAAAAAATSAGLAIATGVGGAATSATNAAGFLVSQAVSLSALNTLAGNQVGADIAAMFAAHGNDRDFPKTAHALVPQIIEHHAETVAEITAEWYDMLDPEAKFTPKPYVEVPPPEKIAKSVDWALYAPGKEPPQARLTGDSQRVVRNVSRQTVTRNAHAEGMRWARYAKPEACPWCRALAIRGSGNTSHKYLYYSDKSAVYRKSDGDKYHTHCECEPVAIRGGHVWTPPDYMAGWKNEYDDVAKSVPNGPKYFQRIVAQMRANEPDTEGDPDAVQ